MVHDLHLFHQDLGTGFALLSRHILLMLNELELVLDLLLLMLAVGGLSPFITRSVPIFRMQDDRFVSFLEALMLGAVACVT